MNRDERKRRFNEAIVNLLYPSPPEQDSDEEPVEALIKGGSYDVISGTLEDSENGSTSSDDDEGGHDSGGTGKLTRAQRKRLRKKKLKEEAIHRGKLIGPLLPPTPITATQCEDKVAEDAPTARSNASEKGDDETACVDSKKIKQRRMAKRLAKENRVAASALEKYHDQDQSV